jgi:hypothetical protein
MAGNRAAKALGHATNWRLNALQMQGACSNAWDFSRAERSESRCTTVRLG